MRFYRYPGLWTRLLSAALFVAVSCLCFYSASHVATDPQIVRFLYGVGWLYLAVAAFYAILTASFAVNPLEPEDDEARSVAYMNRMAGALRQRPRWRQGLPPRAKE